MNTLVGIKTKRRHREVFTLDPYSNLCWGKNATDIDLKRNLILSLEILKGKQLLKSRSDHVSRDGERCYRTPC